MRRLGPTALTGAEKQRRHREKVKARLAEAERLKAVFAGADDSDSGAVAALYDSILAERGAELEERDALRSAATAAEAEIRAVLEARAEKDLAALRERRRGRASSLLARLDAIRPRDDG